jgi:hypothetical protein
LARLNELGSVLGQLDVPSRSPAEEIELKATPEVLRDTICGALLDVGERVAAACHESWRGAPTEMLPQLANQVQHLDAAMQRIADQNERWDGAR